jgi:hypothetical protein
MKMLKNSVQDSGIGKRSYAGLSFRMQLLETVSSFMAQGYPQLVSLLTVGKWKTVGFGWVWIGWLVDTVG